MSKPKTGKYIPCQVCEKEKWVMSVHFPTFKYCSRECKFKSQQTKVVIKCSFCNKDFNIHQSRIKWSVIRGHKHFYCSKQCTYLGISVHRSGANSGAWRGGVTDFNKRIRKGVEWATWRNAVFVRDNYTCQKCGARNGNGRNVVLHPHHLKQYAFYPELRFEVTNGITLCKECHLKQPHKRPTPYPKGEAHKNSSITEDIVREILKAKKETGFGRMRLRQLFPSVSMPTIGAIIRGQSWKHVATKYTTEM